MGKLGMFRALEHSTSCLRGTVADIVRPALLPLLAPPLSREPSRRQQAALDSDHRRCLVAVSLGSNNPDAYQVPSHNIQVNEC